MGSPTTQVTGHKTAIPGLIIFDVSHVGDERGYFQEKYQHQKLVAAGLPKDFRIVQNNVSYNKESGVTRGFHAEPWDKYVSMVTGKVFVAFVDMRKGKSFGKVVTAELTPNQAAFVPKGVGNSFQTLEPDTYYLYSVNDHWQPDQHDKYSFANLADPDIGVQWPVALENAILSERDRNHPLLKDVVPLEV